MAASIAGLSYQELYELNPGHRSTYTDPMAPPRILIPAALNAQVDDRLRNMPTLAQTNPQLLASFGPVGGAVIISGGSSTGNSRGSNYTTQQAAALMSAGTVQQTANTTATTTIRQPVTTTASSSINTTVTTSIRNPLSDPAPVATPAKTATTANTATSIVQSSKRVPTPGSASALAAFASQADVPSSPRIPVAVTPAANIKPIAEPPVSSTELQNILVSDSSVTATTVSAPVVEPQPTDAEKQQVVDELQALAPAGTEVVDPLDGKIKLTAIQTSQSVAEAKGEELKLKYEQPVLVAQQPLSKPVATASISSTVQAAKPVPAVAVVTKPARPAGERMVYAVQPGDTLASIASRHGVNWRDIANWNQIDPSAPLFAGSSLYLYGAKKPEPVKPTSYLVQAGDTLTDVAARFDMTPKQLADLNGMSANSNLLRGARLTLVDNGTASKKAVEEEKTTTTKNKADNSPEVELVSYKVKRGEYLKQIAERYGVTHTELAELNNISANSSLAVGQSIKVPDQKGSPATERLSAKDSSKDSKDKESGKIATTSYTVKSGDTLSKIASRFDTTNDDLAKLNKFSASTMVRLGQVISVPDINVAPEKPSSYQVQSGDTLTAVAAKFDMTPQELASLNDMKASANLIRGATLKLVAEEEKTTKAGKRSSREAKEDKEAQESATLVSSKGNKSSADTESYTVKRGESLHAIAAKYDLTTSELAKLNNISAKAKVQVGQTLDVPRLTSSYTVKSGDTLTRLANKFGLSVNELAKLNQLSPNANVIIGDVLVVPANNNRSL